MVDALKKMDKKFLIIAGLILFLPIVFIIFLVIIQGCDGGKTTHENYENKMITAAGKYLKSEKKEPITEGEVVKVKLSKLIDSGYIKSTEKALDDESCDGSVVVRRNGASVDSNNGGYLNYTVSLECDKYKTVTLNSKIEENVVTEGSGLYETSEGYIFKGNKVNNYINFYGVNYRIMSIDNSGILKLIKSEPEIISRIWDNKYNIEADHSYGKNLYKDSSILTYLLNDYNNVKKFSVDAKKHMVAYDACVGKRPIGDNSINRATDCSEKLENQFISLLNVSDYAMASSDENCTTVSAKSCNNYNYLSGVASSGWTMNVVSDNTYDVYYIANGIAEAQTANSYSEYNLVIYMDGNEKYIEGAGTETSPYIIK